MDLKLCPAWSCSGCVGSLTAKGYLEDVFVRCLEGDDSSDSIWGFLTPFGATELNRILTAFSEGKGKGGKWERRERGKEIKRQEVVKEVLRNQGKASILPMFSE